MNNYGRAALKAIHLINSGESSSPVVAWDKATESIFGANTPSQKKGCPKDTFLGLCEEGLLKDVPKGKYTNSKKNKEYAIKAIPILKSNPSHEVSANAL